MSCTYRPELARDDHLLTASELREKYEEQDPPQGHPQYTRRMWMDLVESSDHTLPVYWDWVELQLEAEQD